MEEGLRHSPVGTPQPGQSWRPLASILVVALLLRCGSAYALQRSLPVGQICLIAGDADGYWALAQNIAHGADYAIYTKPRYVLRMPGFPLLLAGAMCIFGENLLATRFVLAIVGTIACGLVYWLARELVGHTAGLWASLYCALSPTMVLFSVLILSETLFAAALTASLIGVVRLFRRVARAVLQDGPNDGSGGAVLPSAGMTGILIGIATLVRPTWLLVGPFVSIASLLHGRFRVRAWIAAVGVLLGLTLSLAPWTIRNRGVTGHLIPTTLWVGPSLYDGLNPTADGSSHMEFIERDGVYTRLSEYEADQYYRHKAWEFVRAEPWRTVQLGWLKLARYWSPWPNAAQFQSPLLSSALIAQFVLLMGSACVGAWSVIRGQAPWTTSFASKGIVLGVTLGPLLYFAAIHTVFVGSLRYRLPAEYPLSVLSAVGVMVLVTGMQNRLSSRRGVALET